MNIYLTNDYFRVDGITGEVIEKEYASDFMKYDSEIVLDSARNQYLSFQVIFDTQGESIDKMSIDFTDLKGAELISKDEYQVFIEWFHKIKGNLAPDGLIPLNETELEFKVPLDDEYLKDQKVGALWVDLFIPSNVEPGEYKGSVKVIVNGMEKEFGIAVNVYSAVVPNESKLTADLNNYADSLSPYFPSLRDNKDRYDDGSFFELEKKFVRMAREHRGVFHNLGYKHSGLVVDSFAPELEGEGKNIRVKSWEKFDRHFGPYLDGSAFKGTKRGEFPIEFLYLPFNLAWPASYEKWGDKGYKTEYRRIIAEFVRHFEEKGWTETYVEFLLNHKKDYRFFPYTVDEVWYEHDEESIDLYYDVIKDTYEDTNVKFVFRMDSSNHYGNHYDSRYSDMCKLWVAGFDMYTWFPESAKVMRDKGNIVWTYGGGFYGSIDRPLVNIMTAPIHSFMTGANGFCIWQTTDFGRDYLNTPSDNGGLAAFYPGVEFGYEGPLPTIRLKALRNFMQTCDLLMTSSGLDDEGPNTKIRAERIVNKHYNYEDNSCWWMEKPPFVNEPPRTWDFGPSFGQYCMKPAYEGKSPAMIGELRSDVVKLFSK